MGVYIKGMEMPTRCGQCRFFAWSRGVGQHCAVAPDITFHATIDGMDVAYERNGKCPLILIPPHGRLIDADVLKDLAREWIPPYNASVVMNLFDLIGNLADNAPTIIEAEEEHTMDEFMYGQEGNPNDGSM